MALAHSPSVVADSLLLYLDAANVKSYPGTGTTWTNVAGGQNNATLTNIPTFSSVNQGFFTFDGTTQNADIVSPTISLGTGGYSVDGWVYITQSIAAVGRILTFSTPSYALAGDILIGSDQLQFSSRSSLGVDNVASISLTAADQNKWLYFASIRNASTPSLYLYDGSTVRSNTGTSNIVMDLTAISNIRIAQRPATSVHYFGGRISNIRIYNRGLAVSEINQNFNALRGRYGI